MHRNKIYFGDNLEIMREMEDNSIDLICTDPPFNSGRNYNIFLPSKAQTKAFTDIWEWDDYTIETRKDIEERARTNEIYSAVRKALIGYDYVLQHKLKGNKGAMRSYLAFMAPRLVEMHRLLKDTGSIYLHCDPSASHYLKGLMDVIFGDKNFRNEIVWSCHRFTSNSKYQFSKMNDIILFYSKKPSKNTFHKQYTSPRNTDRYERGYHTNTINGVKRLLVYDEEKVKKSNVDLSKYDEIVHTGIRPPLLGQVWDDINFLNPAAKERSGYPTQKPVKLYKRMVEASSNEGDIVFDPFSGCGTTIDAAESLGRNWIGVDITLLALEPMQERLLKEHALRPNIDYDIEGYPTNMEEVHLLVKDQRKYHDFSNWAVTRLGLTPTKDIGDGGFDGVAHFTVWIPEGMKQNEGRIMAEVKSGKPTLNEVKAFCHTMTKNNATAGVFITLHKVSSGMMEEAESMGTFEHNGITYPRLQFWQITQEYFDNPESINRTIRLPKAIKASQKTGKQMKDSQIEMDLAAAGG